MKSEREEPPNFFGLPLEEDPTEGNKSLWWRRRFASSACLSAEVKEGAGQGGLRGLFPDARIYVPLPAAREWALEHRGPMSQVTLALARQSGALGEVGN